MRRRRDRCCGANSSPTGVRLPVAKGPFVLFGLTQLESAQPLCKLDHPSPVASANVSTQSVTARSVTCSHRPSPIQRSPRRRTPSMASAGVSLPRKRVLLEVEQARESARLIRERSDGNGWSAPVGHAQGASVLCPPPARSPRIIAIFDVAMRVVLAAVVKIDGGERSACHLNGAQPTIQNRSQHTTERTTRCRATAARARAAPAR